MITSVSTTNYLIGSSCPQCDITRSGIVFRSRPCRCRLGVYKMIWSSLTSTSTSMRRWVLINRFMLEVMEAQLQLSLQRCQPFDLTGSIRKYIRVLLSRYTYLLSHAISAGRLAIWHPALRVTMPRSCLTRFGPMSNQIIGYEPIVSAAHSAQTNIIASPVKLAMIRVFLM